MYDSTTFTVKGVSLRTLVWVRETAENANRAVNLRLLIAQDYIQPQWSRPTVTLEGPAADMPRAFFWRTSHLAEPHGHLVRFAAG
jgi:hypothetical protein